MKELEWKKSRHLYIYCVCGFYIDGRETESEN